MKGGTGAAGPLVWLGLFDAEQTIPAAEVPQWLAARAGAGLARVIVASNEFLHVD